MDAARGYEVRSPLERFQVVRGSNSEVLTLKLEQIVEMLFVATSNLES